MLKTHKTKEKVKGKTISKHPLDRTFSSIEEAGNAKIDYIISNKPASYWQKLETAIGK